MSLAEKIQTDIVTAMKGRDDFRLSVLRMVKAAIQLKEVEKIRKLDDNESIQLLQTLLKQRKESIDQFTKGGRPELAEKEQKEAAIIEAYLPAGASAGEMDAAITKAIAESGAIVEYIVGSYGNGRLIPAPDTPERLRYVYWLHYAEGSAMPLLLLKLLFNIMPKRAPALLRPVVRKVSSQALTTLVNPQLKQHMHFWESELSKSEWFAGAEFTAADIQMSFPLEAAAARGGLEQGHPNAMAFLDRIHARSAYQRALEKGGPYEVGK